MQCTACLGVKTAQAGGIRRSRFSLANPALGRSVCPVGPIRSLAGQFRGFKAV